MNVNKTNVYEFTKLDHAHGWGIKDPVGWQKDIVLQQGDQQNT